ncbi:MAG: toxin-antitoxin system HicB family antitoxin [Pirellulales bacterium]
MINQSPEKYQEVLQVASNLYRQKPDWVTFFREVLGIRGIVRQHFTDEELPAFEQSREYREIQAMLSVLREQSGGPTEDKEPTRVITVRLPKSLHESLQTQAHERQTSMNKLCISKLLQVIGDPLAADSEQLEISIESPAETQ